ncbi:MAG: MBL fold metallo-hydrolase [Hyphomicrobiaceae bacterium]|nr:MBL fold metallo-hydrolase [Hyphomicrobiaceae bacterium]
MKLTVVGSGDAFGSGGRLQTCYHVAAAPDFEFLIDCGATALIGMARLGLDPNRIDAIYISHLHGDHFSGLVWFLMHAEYVGRRGKPLLLIGPRGLMDRLKAASEALFPGSARKKRRFRIEVYEHVTTMALDIGPVASEAFEVSHPSGAPAYALRFTIGDKVVGFSGDTEWVDNLVEVAAGADLYISECHGYDSAVPHHMSWSIIAERLPQITARRIMLTHMSAPMLANLAVIDAPRVFGAEDGLHLEL